jgi:signal transduction histidine kinase/DNA-binding response OmpR family regulator/ligand-binding sensor domain-containing protein
MKPFPPYLFLLLPIMAVSCRSEPTPVTESTAGRVISADISNLAVTSFAEDEFGHIWIGTLRGLNKYTSREFHQYFNTADSLSLSHNQVSQILRDSQNRLWIATRDGISIYTDCDTFERIPIEASSQNVVQIVEESGGGIFINMVDQLCRFDEQARRFRVVVHDFDTDRNYSTRCFADAAGNLWAVSSNTIRRFDADSIKMESAWRLTGAVHYSWLQPGGLLWLVSGERLSIFDTRIGSFLPVPPAIERHPELLRSVITLIAPWSERALIINTSAGMFLYDFEAQTVVAEREDGFPFAAPDFQVTGMFSDSRGNVWLGSADHGFEVVYGYKNYFNANSHLYAYFAGRSVTAVAQDLEGRLWVVRPELGASVYDPRTGAITQIDTSAFFPASGVYTPGFNNRIKGVFVDNDGFVWLIAEWFHLFKCSFDGHRVTLIKDFRLPLSINTMLHDSHGVMWAAGTDRNVWTMRPGEANFTSRSYYRPNYLFTNQIKELSDGRVIVASFDENPVLVDRDGEVVDSLVITPSLVHPVFVPTMVFEDSRRDIWIGALFNGLYRYSRERGVVERFGQIASDEVCSIQEDTDGNLWIATLFGLSKLDPASGHAVNYFKSDGIGGNQFNERASCRLADGTLVFGGTHGLTFFTPPEKEPRRRVRLVFENLKVGAHDISPRDGRIIDRGMAHNPRVRLRHNENSFFISFAALDYSEFDRVKYFGMMEGWDNQWLDAGSNREAYFSNLPPGRYTFRVRVTDRAGTRTEAENSIDLRIAPAPMASCFAVCAYLLLLGTGAFFAGRLGLKMRRDRRTALELKREKEQREQINRMNMSFFANVSHEFRTPLTMISGPVNTLCADEAITPENRKLLHIVQRSVGRMLKLVDQLMDFNKLEGDSLRLRVSRTDVVSVLKNITDIFRINASNKNLDLITSGLEDAFITWLDTDKVDKIMGNLLSNAMKFTPAGGKIKISLDYRPGELTVTVADTGSGIPEDELESIFERYYQIIDSDRNTHNMGTGIGLYYSRRLASLHHGSITAANNPDGGAVFTLTLPTGDDTYPPEERVAPHEQQDTAFPLATRGQLGGFSNDEKTGDDKKYTLLVVDDDTEVGHYLNTLLSPLYRVINRFDAESALAAIEQEAPDLIVSDVVMPRMSGYDLCRRVKGDLQLCHIPVVLVTAKTSVESQVEGLDTGADAYVTKPFDPNYLLALLKSLLKNRENVRSLLTHETKADRIDKNILSPQDKAFMTEVYRLMESELSNPELNIHQMTEALHISRTKLYYKLKGLTGTNPNIFFKTYRLNRAAELLREGRFNISEIADRTGFSTLSHFSASFKEQFGVSPSKYV